MDLYEEQLKLESSAVEDAKTVYEQTLLKKKAKGDITGLRPEQKLLEAAITPLVEKLEEELNKTHRGSTAWCWELIGELKPFEVAYITAKHVVMAFSVNDSMQQTANTLGGALILQRDFNRLKGDHPVLVKLLKEQMKLSTPGHQFRVWRNNINSRYAVEQYTSIQKATLGLIILNLFTQSSGVVQVGKMPSNRGRSLSTLEPTPEAQEWLKRGHERCVLLSPTLPPMIVPPMEWSNNSDGGYLSNFGTKRRPLIKSAPGRDLDEVVGKAPLVIKAVNAVQNTPWRINTRVMEVLKEVHALGGDVAGIPQIDFQKTLPAKPWTTEEEFKEFKATRPEELQNWCYQKKMAYAFWVRNTGKREALHYKIFFSNKYKDRALYFPSYLDWRGRLYPHSNFVSPQGDDSGKALLEFNEAKPLGTDGEYWLKIHLANCAGVDKVSFDDRIKWVEENKNLILHCAKDPFGERAWMDMDSPFKFLAAAFEMADLEAQGSAFCSRTAVAMDGSCNGLQHYSAILRDAIGGKAVNLVPGEVPGDVYAEVAKAVVPLVLADAVDGNELAQAWAGKIDRSIVKRNVMTLVYGVTRFGMAEQLMAEIQKRSTTTKAFLDTDRDMQAAVYLAEKINSAISTVAVAAKEGMAWLQEAANVVSETGQPLVWTVPSGFEVSQFYSKTKLKPIVTLFGTCKRSTFGMKIPTGEINKQGQRNGIAPNFVHSLDASHLMSTVGACLDAGMSSFGMVHDSYAVHACHTSQMNKILRDEFVSLYEHYSLEDFKNEVESRTGVELPPCPSKGSLDLSQVKSSPYFFA